MHRVLLGLATLVGPVGHLAAAEAPRPRPLTGTDALQAQYWLGRMGPLVARGKLAEALELAEKIYRLRRDKQGADHWETWDARSMIDDLKYMQRRLAGDLDRLKQAGQLHDEGQKRADARRFAEAEALFRRALAIRRQVLPADHRAVAQALNSLAGSLGGQGRVAEAEKLHRQAFVLRDKVLPAGHPDRAEVLQNLADSIHAQGRAAEAEKIYRQLLPIRETALGPNHPAVAHGLNGLASILHEQGQYAEAETLLRRALAIRRQTLLTTDHAGLAQTLNGLGGNLDAQGRPGEAEELHRQALTICRKMLSPDHPLRAACLNSLGLCLHQQGRYAEAEALLRQGVALSQKGLSADDAGLAQSLHHLARNLDVQGRAAEAEDLHRRALAIREKALPAGHRLRATSLHYLADNLHSLGKHAEAEGLHRRARAILEKALPATHPHRARNLSGIGYSVLAQGRAAEAEKLLRQALAILEQGQAAGHPDRGRSLQALAVALLCQGRAAEAEKLLRQARENLEQALPAGHPDLAIVLADLGMTLNSQGKSDEALALLRQAGRNYEAARLRAGATGADRAAFAATHFPPNLAVATILARRGLSREAWQAAEAQLARGLLDDLSPAGAADLSAAEQARLRDWNAELTEVSRQAARIYLKPKPDAAQQERLRQCVARSRVLAGRLADLAAGQSRKQVAELAEVQRALPADAALVFGIDWRLSGQTQGEHWGCVVRAAGPPVWVPLKGSGARGAWTAADLALTARLRQELSRPGGGGWRPLADKLSRQRLAPLEPHLDGVRRLIVVPTGPAAEVPLEVLTERYQASYAPSATVYARLMKKHRPLGASLLAVGDPAFRPAPPPPDHGLYVRAVLPGSNAARAGLQAGDVLLSYNGVRLRTGKDLRLVREGTERLPVRVWRDGQVQERTVAPGPLGVAGTPDPPAVVLRQQRAAEALLGRRAGHYAPLPGTRLEVEGLARFFDKKRLLLGPEASPRRLDELAAAGELARYRVLHFATHGEMHPTRPALCALILAPDPARPMEEGQKISDGRLTAAALQQLPLDADLVVLSACETALGPDGRGEGLLGFSQALFRRGARSLVLSLWKVDDLATALLMHRFYQNLLGKREDLKAPLGRAAALAEAKRWLRELTRAEAEKLSGRLGGGAWRGRVEKLRLAAAKEGGETPMPQPTDRPFAHPAYWSAFILLGDPD